MLKYEIAPRLTIFQVQGQIYPFIIYIYKKLKYLK